MPKYKGRRINPEFVWFWIGYTAILTFVFSMIHQIFLLLCPLISLIVTYYQLEAEIKKRA